jgi:hypothetical protein
MLMDNVRRDCIEERAIMGSENRWSENGQRITPLLTRRQVFRAMSGGNLPAMPTHSGRLEDISREQDL